MLFLIHLKPDYDWFSANFGDFGLQENRRLPSVSNWRRWFWGIFPQVTENLQNEHTDSKPQRSENFVYTSAPSNIQSGPSIQAALQFQKGFLVRWQSGPNTNERSVLPEGVQRVWWLPLPAWRTGNGAFTFHRTPHLEHGVMTGGNTVDSDYTHTQTTLSLKWGYDLRMIIHWCSNYSSS